MSSNQPPQWLSLDKLPVVSQAVEGMASDTQELHKLFFQAKDKPWVLDDVTVNRATRLLTERLELLSLYTEQLTRWKKQQLTPQQRARITILEKQTATAVEQATHLLALAEEIKQNTIDQILARDDAALALDVLTGKLKVPQRSASPNSASAGSMRKRKRKSPVSRRRSRSTQADLGVWQELDHMLAWERDMEQRYHLPFRMPSQVATSLQQCMHCHHDIALLIFGDNASDVAGLEAYARLMAEPLQQTNLPAYVLGRPSGIGHIDEQPSLLLKVWPHQEEPRVITPTEWEQLIKELSHLHCP